jgi:hypothetical protein
VASGSEPDEGAQLRADFDLEDASQPTRFGVSTSPRSAGRGEEANLHFPFQIHIFGLLSQICHTAARL